MTQPLREFYGRVLGLKIASATDIRRFDMRLNEGGLTRGNNALSHICVMAVVFDPLSGSLLLVNHKRAGSWIFPGGHVEGGELPDATAVREVAEELGLTVRLDDLLGPFSFKVLDIDNPPQVCREHFDLFYAIAATASAAMPVTDEFLGAEWLDLAAARERISSTYYREALEMFAAFMGW